MMQSSFSKGFCIKLLLTNANPHPGHLLQAFKAKKAS